MSALAANKYAVKRTDRFIGAWRGLSLQREEKIVNAFRIISLFGVLTRMAC